MDGQARPQFDLGALLGNAVGATFNSAFGRDCKGRPQGDYFFGCQCVGPFNIGRKKRSPQDTRFFINSNQVVIVVVVIAIVIVIVIVIVIFIVPVIIRASVETLLAAPSVL